MRHIIMIDVRSGANVAVYQEGEILGYRVGDLVNYRTGIWRPWWQGLVASVIGFTIHSSIVTEPVKPPPTGLGYGKCAITPPFMAQFELIKNPRGEERMRQLNVRQKRIMVALEQQGGKATALEVAEETGFHINGVSQTLRALGLRGYLFVNGTLQGTETEWCLLDPDWRNRSSSLVGS